MWRKDQKHPMERDGEGGGGIQLLQLAAGRPSDEGQASSQFHEEARRRRRRSEF